MIVSVPLPAAQPSTPASEFAAMIASRSVHVPLRAVAEFSSAVESTTLVAALLLESSGQSPAPEIQSDGSHRPSPLWDSPKMREVLSMLSEEERFRFELSNPDAIDKLRPWYDEKLLQDARAFLAEVTDDQILEEPFQDFTDSDGSAASGRRQFALAHALFERGFFPSRGDRNPRLFVSPTPCKR